VHVVQVGPVSYIRPGDGRCRSYKQRVLFFSPLHGRGVIAQPALKGMFLLQEFESSSSDPPQAIEREEVGDDRLH
jgi:hypothetical protein